MKASWLFPTDAQGETDPVTSTLRTILSRAISTVHDGTVADYIPALARADPNHVGGAVTSVRGRSYDAGDAAEPFTIQSISKPFVFALALSSRGRDTVLDHVGVEPSGEAFNAISFDAQGRPANPMINAGALVATSLIAASDSRERVRIIADGLSAFAGRPLTIDEEVYVSEVETGERNRALASLAKASGVLAASVADATDAYFRQCSLSVTCRDLAIMAATLANGGVNPVTGIRVVSEAVTRDTLAVMAACGMYDHSGEWLVDVGLPAKSGVSGGILAVAAGEYGISVFSPPLDTVGNSRRGVAALRDLSREFDVHLFQLTHVVAASVRFSFEETGGSVVTVYLRARVDFVTAEDVLAEMCDRAETGLPQNLVLNLTEVHTISRAAERLLRALLGALRHGGYAVSVVDPQGLADFGLE